MRILFIYFILLTSTISAQNLGILQDDRDYFFVFDGLQFEFLEHQPIKNVAVGKKYIAYTDYNGQFWIYAKGKKNQVPINSPKYISTDHYLTYFLDSQLFLYNGSKIKKLESWVENNFVVSDSILAYTNTYQRFNAYYEDSTYTLELNDVKTVKAGDNLIAYVDANGIFKVFYKGERQDLADFTPLSFEVSADVVSYVDAYGDFNIWYKGDIFDVQHEQIPSLHKAGEQMVAYMSDLDNFVVFYKGEVYDLLSYKPTYVLMQDNMLVYADAQGFLYAFYEGKTTRIAGYTPKRVVLDNDLVVFTDLDGYLKGFYKGQKIDVSKDIVMDFEVYNHTVIMQTRLTQWKAFNNGQVYTFD